MFMAECSHIKNVYVDHNIIVGLISKGTIIYTA